MARGRTRILEDPAGGSQTISTTDAIAPSKRAGLRLAVAALAFVTWAAPATATANQLGDLVEYEVQPGDTLSDIAARFGIDSETIIWENDLRNPDHIVTGQVLRILPVAGMRYTVRAGDTLSAIATRYDVEPSDILRWNGLTDPDLIVLGTELLLPGAKARPTLAPQPAASVSRASPPAPAAPEVTATADGRSFAAKITAYSYQAPIGGARGSTTRSGTPVRWGVLAVDPAVIPLGSRVMIEGFDDVFVAEDTGSAVRGNHVEIFYPDHAAAVRFGVQTRLVTILD